MKTELFILFGKAFSLVFGTICAVLGALFLVSKTLEYIYATFSESTGDTIVATAIIVFASMIMAGAVTLGHYLTEKSIREDY